MKSKRRLFKTKTKNTEFKTNTKTRPKLLKRHRENKTREVETNTMMKTTD